MALYLVATPIGNENDISIRGLEILRKADHIILEERKEGTSFLRKHQISGKNYRELNEHTDKKEVEELCDLCKEHLVALITDCGTPGFADPGADLVRLCRQQNIPIHSVPGASSLMTLLSLAGQKVGEFLFRGFLSAENELRKSQWQELKKEKRAIIIMDTPYRLEKTVHELQEHFPSRRILIGLNLTQDNEWVCEGLPQEIARQNPHKKAEFMVLIYPL